MFGYFIILPKLIGFVLHLLFGLLIVCVLNLLLGSQWYTKPFGGFVKQQWMKMLAIILNLKINHNGSLSKNPVVFVSNHISWLDVVALGCDRNCVFVAKNSVKKWPLIGTIAKLNGTLFINREDKKDIVKTLAKANNILASGVSIAFFPEATTTNGKVIKPFRTSLYQTAIHSSSNVQAIGIRYSDRKGKESPAPYVDDETFIAHLFKVLKTPKIEVKLAYCKPVEINNSYNRKILAETTQMQVAEILALPNPG